MESLQDIVQPLRIADPPQGFRFLVSIMAGGILPNPIDIHFQSVSGISAKIETSIVEEGSQNQSILKLPVNVSFPNDLVLERGLVIGSPLHLEFLAAVTTLNVYPSNILVSLLNNLNIPIANWLFMEAFPIEWDIPPLDATKSDVVIERMVLTYSRFRALVL